MSRAVRRWSKDLEVLNIVVTTSDFQPTDVITSREVKATVQPAQKRRLNPDIIDWSLKYVQVHVDDAPVLVGEFIKHEGVVYKFIDDGDFQRYGFTDAVAEEAKAFTIVHSWIEDA